MDERQKFGFAGAGLLLLGVFAPLFSAPVIGSQNYIQSGQGDGIVILGLALITAIMVVLERYTVLWYTGLGSLLAIGYTFFEFQRRINDVRAEMAAELSGNPFAGLAEIALDSVQLQWGWAVLLIGAILILVAAQKGTPTGQGRGLDKRIGLFR